MSVLAIGLNKDVRLIAGAPCLVKSAPKKSSISLIRASFVQFCPAGTQKDDKVWLLFSPCDTLARSQFGKIIEPST